MAEALVGGVLSAFLKVAFDRLASREVLDFLKGRKPIDGLVQKLKIELISADAVLVDAEEKQITNPAVEEWLDELKDAVYVADDLLDEIAYEAMRCNLEAESQNNTSKVWNSFSISIISFNKRIQSELEKILESLKNIIAKQNELGLKKVVGGVTLQSPRLTTSCPEKCGVFGRDIDKEVIFKFWQLDDASSDGICVVPIVAGFDTSKKFEIPYEAKGLRTFFGEDWISFKFDEYNNVAKMIDDFLQAFKSLRVLSLSRCTNILELPVSVGNLKHLRYLNIQDTKIEHLPDSFCSLYNLQTLILSSYIIELPDNMSKLINMRHLDNSDTEMKEMPPQMALKAILEDKQDLSKLELEWKLDHETKDSVNERNVLEQLCPHTNLISLTIKNYEGTFPNWVGDCSFSNMVSLKLYDCKYCFSLPPLGQLPALKKLKIKHFDGVFCVGDEFYGNGFSTIKPFRSLGYLSFEYMPEWQEWVIFEGEIFSCLRELCIYSCPKLSGGLPNHLPSLTKLEIRDCEKLVFSLPRAPALHELNCNGKIQLPSGHYYASLETMKICGGCDSLWSISLELFPKLKSIEMYDCENLESLSASKGSYLDLTSLSLGIMECPNFVSFPRLTEIIIFNCKILKSLPEEMRTILPSLVALQLYGCPELESFPQGSLPSNLVTLCIFMCEKLISCCMEWGLQGLHSLKVFKVESKCEEVESFPEEALLPPTLTTFSI
nr:putative disease resistance rpp13-like protein 1 [Quercus suber]